jgi:DNA-binding XRE family transcriptional regulator
LLAAENELAVAINLAYYFCRKNRGRNMVAAIQAGHKPDPGVVLGKAVTRAADRLGLSKALLARIIGVSPSTVTRIYDGRYLLDQNRKEWDFALLFVRVFRSLDSIVGNEGTAQKWLRSQNQALNGRPIELITNTEGLVRVVHYLDASRGLV